MEFIFACLRKVEPLVFWWMVLALLYYVGLVLFVVRDITLANVDTVLVWSSQAASQMPGYRRNLVLAFASQLLMLWVYWHVGSARLFDAAVGLLALSLIHALVLAPLLNYLQKRHAAGQASVRAPLELV